MTRVPGRWKRQALLAVAVSVLLVTAGCSGFLDSGGDGAGSGAQLDSVPNDAEFVGYVDASGMLADDSLRSLANTALETQAAESPYYQGPESVSEMLEQFEDESGLSAEKFHDVTFFGSSGDRVATNAEQSGMIVTSEFSEDEIVSAMEDSGTELSEETYEDTTIYTYGFEGGSALAALGDGTFALGDPAAVESVLDVRAGDADALGDDLRTTFENTDDGHVRFAMDVPQEQIPSEELGADAPLDTSAFNTVQFVSGSVSTSGNSVNVNLNMVSESADDAERTSDLVDGALSVYSGIGNDEIRSTLEKLSVEQNGDTTTVSFTDNVENLEDLIEEMYSMGAGASGTASGSNSASVATTA